MSHRLSLALGTIALLTLPPAAEAAPRDSVKVVFATNRDRLPDKDVRIFGDDFNPGGDSAYTTGSITVRHVSDKPDLGWEPDGRTLVIDSAAQRSIVAFTARQGARKASQAGYGVVLLPGFASTFKDALRRAAQVSQAYGAEEALVFSWPANGRSSLVDYRRDRADAERSGPAMSAALKDFLEATKGSNHRYKLVAHSMGAFALRSALQTVKRERPDLLVRPRSGKPIFDVAIAAAADEDDDALSDENRLAPLTRLAKDVVVYRSGGDIALGVSQLVNGRPRLGQSGPRDLRSLPRNVSVVDVSDVGATSGDRGESHFGHQYYRASARVVGDARLVVRDTAPAAIPGRMPFPPDATGPRA